MDLQLLERTAREAVTAAGDLVRRGLAADPAELGLEYKGDANPVTAVDKAAEAAILGVIRGRTPEIGVLAEEGGFTKGDDERHMWCIDPLDGTANFSHGSPHCSVSVACLADGRPVVGCVLDVARSELFHAVRGGGAWLDDRPLRVSAKSVLDQSLLVTGFAYDRRTRPDRYLPLLERLMRLGEAVRVMGSAALDLAWVAAGRFDAFWEAGLNPWDVAAGALLVEEAGGRIGTYRGDDLDVLDPRLLVASNGHIHDEMTAILREYAPNLER